MTFVVAARTGEAQATVVDPLTLTIPSGISNNHTGILVVNTDGTSVTLTTPSGWTQIGTVEQGSGNSQMFVYKRSLVSGDVGATITMDFSGTVRCGAIFHAYSGRDTASVTTSVNTSATAVGTYDIPTATVAAGSDLAGFAMRRRSGVAPASITMPAGYTAPTTATGTYFNNYATGVNTFGASAYQQNVSAGSQGGGTASNTAATNIGYTLLVVLPALVTNVSPTANAGANQVNIEPYTPVTLVGTDSDTDGSVVTRAWTQTPVGGVPTVTLSGTGASRTFEAPGTLGGVGIDFVYTVTDNGGATASDNMVVSVLAVTDRAVIGGAEVPMKIMTVKSANFMSTESNDILTVETGDPILL